MSITVSFKPYKIKAKECGVQLPYNLTPIYPNLVVLFLLDNVFPPEQTYLVKGLTKEKEKKIIKKNNSEALMKVHNEQDQSRPEDYKKSDVVLADRHTLTY